MTGLKFGEKEREENKLREEKRGRNNGGRMRGKRREGGGEMGRGQESGVECRPWLETRFISFHKLKWAGQL